MWLYNVEPADDAIFHRVCPLMSTSCEPTARQPLSCQEASLSKAAGDSKPHVMSSYQFGGALDRPNNGSLYPAYLGTTVQRIRKASFVRHSTHSFGHAQSTCSGLHSWRLLFSHALSIRLSVSAHSVQTLTRMPVPLMGRSTASLTLPLP